MTAIVIPTPMLIASYNFFATITVLLIPSVTPQWDSQWVIAIFFFNCATAFPGFRPLGQVFEQFIMV
jgi:hypothetical protein